MMKRAITGGFFVAILTTAIILGEWYFHILMAIIAVLTLSEYYKLFPQKQISPNAGFGLVIGFLLFELGVWSLSFAYASNYLLALLLLSFPLLAFSELYRKHKAPFQNIGITILGWIYIVLPLALLHQLMWDDNTEGWTNYLPVLTIFVLVWTNDTFAYLSGKNFGKRKLFERISPNKTWEGFAGGLVFTMFVAYVIAVVVDEPIGFYMGLAALIACIGTAGDLVESMLKRSVGVKDSGTILPGHGGLLDRIDGVLFVIPSVYMYYVLF